MKKLLKVLSMSSLLVSGLVLSSCGEKNDPSSNSEQSSIPSESNSNSSSIPSESSSNSSSIPSESSTSSVPGQATYTIKAVSISGKPIKNAIVSTTVNGEEITMATDSEGLATFNAPSDKLYILDVVDPDGYTLNDDLIGIAAEANQTVELTFTPYLIEDYESLPSFSEFDQMYNYEFTGIESVENATKINSNVKKSIKEELEDHDLVVLNFWYTTCSWCVREFPYLMESYEKYKDSVSLIEIDPGESSNDTVETVSTFLQTNKYDFFTTVGDYNLISAFAISGYPTTVFIDKYGTITSIDGGAITSVDKWDALFEKYTGEDYVQSYEGNSSTVIPTTTFPGSDALANIALAGDDIKKTGVLTFNNEERENYKTYNWPWNVNGDAISPTNKGTNSSYSIVYFDVTVPANKALTLDYKVSCEDGDIFGVYVDGKLMFQDAGNGDKYTTKCVFVSGETEETITVELLYYKDSKLSLYDDNVYVKNIKFVDTDAVGEFRQIRQASTGELDPVDKVWENYITAVLGSDGYYHVGNQTGPLLFAALVDSDTHFSNDSVATLLTSFTDDLKKAKASNGKTYYDILTSYASYCNNSSVSILDMATSGVTPITEELKEALVWLASEFGDEAAKDNENQWLEMCIYIDEYNISDANKLGDPIKGLATFSAFESKINYTSADTNSNYIKFDFPLVPRGYLFAVTPEQSGVYEIKSVVKGGVTECFFYNADGSSSYGNVERGSYARISGEEADENFVYHFYYEAGHTYYVAPCWWDINNTDDTLYFEINYIGESYKYLSQASEGTFTYDSDSSGNISQYISIANVNVQLGEDNYYHPVVEGVIQDDKYIYADFKYVTSIINSMNLETATTQGAFNFTLEALQKEFVHYTTDSDGNLVYDDSGNPISTPYTETELEQIFTLEDKTSEVKSIIEANMVTDTNSIYYGTIKVDNTLCSLLTQLVAKYTFINQTTIDGATKYSPVDGAWLKVCYYEIDLGTNN